MSSTRGTPTQPARTRRAPQAASDGIIVGTAGPVMATTGKAAASSPGAPSPHHRVPRLPDAHGTDPGAGATPGGRAASRVAAGLLGTLGGFQLALAAGAPWGEAAWGGASATLPPGLRVASGVAGAIWSGAALVALRQGGHETWAPVPDRWLRRTTIGLAAYSGVGVLMNLASRSELERTIWTPTTLAMAVTLTLAALRGRRPVT